MSSKVEPTTGPQWVCEQAKTIALRGSLNSLLIAADQPAEVLASIPTKSRVMITPEFPAPSLSAKPLA